MVEHLSLIIKKFWSLLILSADNLSKQFGSGSGPTKWRASGPKLFGTLIVFLKEFFENVSFEKSADVKKAYKDIK